METRYLYQIKVFNKNPVFLGRYGLTVQMQRATSLKHLTDVASILARVLTQSFDCLCFQAWPQLSYTTKYKKEFTIKQYCTSLIKNSNFCTATFSS